MNKHDGFLLAKSRHSATALEVLGELLKRKLDELDFAGVRLFLEPKNLRLASALGAKVLPICNVVGSTMTREADGVIYTHAGPEIGVASTKAFTTQLVALVLFALHLGKVKGALDLTARRALVDGLVALPRQIESCLELNGVIEKLAQELMAQSRHRNRRALAWVMYDPRSTLDSRWRPS